MAENARCGRRGRIIVKQSHMTLCPVSYEPAFHSTTFEFTKLLFCDVFNNPKMSSLGLSIAIATIVGEINTVFGDPSLYNGTLYAVEVATLNKEIDENREKMAKSLKGSVFSNDVYSTRDVMLKRFATNTYTTYI